MVKIVILGIPNDYHIMAVEWGLRRLGAEVYIWMPGDLPDMCTASISFAAPPAVHELRVRHNGREVRLDDADLVWNRRARNPIAPDTASEYDRVPIERESLEHVRNIKAILGSRIPTVNCPSRQFVADRKAVQIRTAIEAGFNVPPTLFSNDPEEISRFFDRYGPLVAKPYRPYMWRGEAEEFALYTFELPDPAGLDPASLSHCPMIFQQKLVRRQEVRLIAFGDEIVAVAMADADGSGSLDSRRAMQENALSFRTVEAPASVRAACKAYMAALDIHYGAFDLLVSDDGSWHFLECNEAGQFLFLEQTLPETQLLERFCRWLFRVAGGADEALLDAPMSVAAFEAERGERVRTRQQEHKPLREHANTIVEFQPPTARSAA